MPVSRRPKANPEENGKASGHVRPERHEGEMPSDRMQRRTEAFQKALNRKGLPITWGTGKPRDDPAWKKDMGYLIEDGVFDKNGRIVR